MTLELKPHGNKCNVGCIYCYENAMREAGNLTKSPTYDLDLMFQRVDEAVAAGYASKDLALFGGEALLLKKSDIRRVFEYAKSKRLHVGAQSNGVLFDDEHIALWKEFNATAGISIDGPEELNDLRLVGGSIPKTREATAKTIENIEKLRKAGVKTYAILTVHKLNGAPKHINKLIDFIRYLGDIGITEGNIHMLEVDSDIVSSLYKLTPEQNTEAFLTLAKFFSENRDLKYSPFFEMIDAVSGQDMVGCTFRSCDPMNTQAVYGIEGNGEISNCGMVNKEGIEWVKATDRQHLRNIMLYQVPPEDGGCKGCPYFTLCSGYCPGSSIDGDWRNKTIHCSTLKSLFAYYEEKCTAMMHEPFTKREDINEINLKYIDGLLQGKIISVPELLRM
jgi:uncharacterized protein